MPTKLLVIASSALMLSFAASSAHASHVQQGLKLVGTGAAGFATQGFSVAVSADGNTAVVGGISDNVSIGAAWVFVRSGGVWGMQAKLVGTGGVGATDQGSVALSADGNTAVVGGYGDNGVAGAAWVFTRAGTVWSQQGAKLVGTGAVGAARQGYSVAVSGDGNTAVVGGFADNGGVGAAWVYTRSGGVWSQQGGKLVGIGAVGNANQGYSVSVSADGNTAVMGGPADNSSAGAAWVFVRSGGVWGMQAKVVGTGAAGVALQGTSVAVSGDGNTAVVGGYFDNGTAGATWVFTRGGTVWSQHGTKLVGTDAVGAANEGYSVSVSGDGNTVLVGGYQDNSSVGAAWVFNALTTAVGDRPAEKVSLLTFRDPTSGQTQIAFALPSEGPVALGIYDVVGRRLRQWKWSTLPAGQHQVQWNGRADDGHRVPPGVLFYRLESGGKTLEHKAVHLQ